MAELGAEVSVVGMAKEYAGLCDILVVDTQDAGRWEEVLSEGMEAAATDTIMHTDDDKVRLARVVLELAEQVEYIGC